MEVEGRCVSYKPARKASLLTVCNQPTHFALTGLPRRLPSTAVPAVIFSPSLPSTPLQWPSFGSENDTEMQRQQLVHKASSQHTSHYLQSNYQHTLRLHLS